MLPLLIIMYIKVLFCVTVISLANAEIRTLTSVLNPGCNNCTSTVVYVKATGDNDIVHQIWDFSHALPTIVFFITGLNSNFTIQWRGSIPSKFIISETPKYSFGLALKGIIEYDDLMDKAEFDPVYPHRIHLFKSWHRSAAFVGNDEDAMLLMCETLRGAETPTKFEYRLESSNTQSSSALLPHLLFTPNATIMDITLSNVSINPEYNSSRMALQFVMASTDNSSDRMRYVVEKSLDDEHAPGVFQMTYLKTPKSFKTDSADGGYLQFRPVAYREYKRDIAASTSVRVSQFKRSEFPPGSSMKLFYSDDAMFPKSALLVEDVVISFGEPGDGFYKRFNLTAWESSLGYGSPPPESFSPLVVSVMALGLGLPLVGLGAMLLLRRRAAS